MLSEVQWQGRQGGFECDGVGRLAVGFVDREVQFRLTLCWRFPDAWGGSEQGGRKEHAEATQRGCSGVFGQGHQIGSRDVSVK